MVKLAHQFLRFGIVGLIAFIVDFVLYTFLCNELDISYIIAGIIGFVVSVIVNYILSMKFVFKKREDTSKQRDFVIFVLLSTVGLILNEIILFVCIDEIYGNTPLLQGVVSEKTMNIIAKIIATGIVMIYNFLSKKLTLERSTEKRK